MNVRKGKHFKRIIAFMLATVMLLTSADFSSGYASEVIPEQTQSESQLQDTTAPPVTQTAPPVTQTAPPETHTAPPETQKAPPETQKAPSETQTAPLETQTEAPKETQSQTQQTDLPPQTQAPAETESMASSEQTNPPEETETQAQSDQTEQTQTESQSESMDAANTFDLRAVGEGDVNISVDSELKTDGNLNPILSGEEFQYVFKYTVPSAGADSSDYQKCSIMITLPLYTIPIIDINGKYAVSGVDVQADGIVYNERSGTLLIPLNSPLPSSGAQTVTVRLRTNNLETPDGTVLNFRGTNNQGTLQIYMKGTYLKNDTPVEFSKSVPDKSVSVRAASSWNISKSVVDSKNVTENNTPYCDVTYQVKVNDPKGINRYGRLGFAKAGYSITDTLPTALADGSALPAGGEAIAVKDVSIVRDGANKPLTSEDYTVIESNGHPASIQFKKLDTVEISDQYTTVGQEKDTVYQYTVRYPMKPYYTPATSDYEIEYQLRNTANLKYTLLGQSLVNKSSDAVITISGWENAPSHADISVKKMISVGGETYDLTDAYAAKYGEAKFGLFSDAACTQYAVDLTKKQVPETTVGSDGTITFKNLRFGTYYLKETVVPVGFKAIKPIKVEIAEADSSVTIQADPSDSSQVSMENGKIIVKNQAVEVGVVSFTKQGKDATGNAIKNLAGATFTLTGTAGTTTGPYTAVSDASGLVRFDGVMKGSYILKETDLSQSAKDEGYVVSDKTLPITIAGDDVVKPDFGGSNIFINESPKGRIKVIKEDAMDQTKLSGAVFDVYGPYSDENAAKAAAGGQTITGTKATTMITGDDGTLTSIALDEGWYVLDETKAPINHVINSERTVIQVNRQSIVETIIENYPEAKVSFSKKGMESASSAFVQELAGAKFHIYDASKKLLKGIKDDKDDYRVDDSGQAIELTTVLDGTGKSVSNGVYLQPGTYYYEEIAVPSPYQPSTDKIQFTVADIAAGGTNLNQIITIHNYLEFGQIKIIKKATDTGDYLNNAVFGVYSDAACTKLVEKVTTMSYLIDDVWTDGIGLTSSKLALGTYYVKELTAPAGYAIHPEIKQIKIEEKGIVEYEAENEPTVSITITKQDSVNTGTKLSGAQFTLYKSDKKTVVGSPQTTDNKGQCTFDNLDPNTTYYYKETKAPNNYVGDTEFKEVTTSSTTGGGSLNTSVTVTNDRKASLIVEKITTMDGLNAPLTGVSFDLYKKGNPAAVDFDLDTGKIKIGTNSTAAVGANAQAKWHNLVPGEYWLVEKLPQGYQTLDDTGKVSDANETKITSVTVNPGDNIAGYSNHITNITNNPTMGKIQIGKFGTDVNGNAADSKPLSGVTFGIYKDAEASADQAAEFTTGANGTGISSWIAPGTYYLKETKAKDGYVLSDTIYEVEVTAGKTITTSKDSQDLTKITNDKKGRFTIEKYGAFNVSGQDADKAVLERLAGASFALYPYTVGETQAPDNKPAVKSFKMDNYTYTVSDLNPGIYWLKETATPDDELWTPIDDALIKVNPDGTVAYGTMSDDTSISYGSADAALKIELKDYSKKPRIRIFKYEFNTVIPLNGADFELYVVSDSGEDTLVKLAGSTADGTTVKLTKVNTGDIQSGTAVDKNGNKLTGQAITPLLEAGKTYYIKEIKSPNNYYFDKDRPWSGPINISAGDSSEHQIKVYNYKNQILAGDKIDAGGSALAGAVVGLFNTKADADAMMAALTNEYNEAVEKADAVGTQKYRLTEAMVDNAFKTKYNIAQTAKSDSKGKINFQNLIPGNTYYAVELVAPSGYQLERDSQGRYMSHPITVGADGLATSSWSIEDPALHNILFQKIFKLSGKDYTFEGPTFTIYGSKVESTKVVPDTANPVAVITAMNANGYYASKQLPAGTYFICETLVPDGFAEETGARANVIEYNNERYYKVELGPNADNDYFKTNPITNIAENGKFILKKVSSQNASTLVAATFAIDKYEDAAQAFVSYAKLPSITTSKTDVLTYSAFLEPGLYRLTETKADGYTLVTEPIYVRIGAGQLTDDNTILNEQVTIDGTSKSVSVYQPAGTVSNTLQPITLSNVPKGAIMIHKVATWNGIKQKDMQGVTFEVYNVLTSGTDAMSEAELITAFNNDKAAQSSKPVGTLTTGKDGKATLGNLDAGSYWLIETGVSAADKVQYGKDAYAPWVVKVTPEASTNAQIEIENTSNYGKFQIKKQDRVDHTLLNGAEFEIMTKAAGELYTSFGGQKMTANGNGTYTSPLLPPGTYYLKEITTPTDYTNEENKNQITGPYTVTANTLTKGASELSSYVVTNEHDCTLIINKYEKNDTGETTNLITTDFTYFALYKTEEEAKNATYVNGKASGTPVREGSTQSIGKLIWTGLANGTYYLKELKAPDKYIIDDTVHAIVLNNAADTNADGSRKFIYDKSVYNVLRGSFILKKVTLWKLDSTQTEPVPVSDVVFEVYKDSYNSANLVGKVTTDKNGLADSNDGVDAAGNPLRLDAGTYVLHEIVPEGYVQAQDITIVITDSMVNVQHRDSPIENIAEYGRFQLTKKAANDNKNLSGATYYVEQKQNDGTWVRLRVGSVDYITVAQEEIKGNLVDGTYISGLLPPGTYRVIERSVPSAIQNASGKDISFALDPTPIEFVISAAFTVQVEQKDSPKVDLIITKTSDEQNGSMNQAGVKFKLWTYKDADETGSEGLDKILVHKDVQIDSEKATAADGTVVFTSLNPGKYVLEETQSLPGYAKTALIVEIRSDHSIEDVLEALTVVNASVEGRLRIRKVDLDGNLICKDGLSATFKVYAKDDMTTALDTIVVENGKDGISNVLLPMGDYWIVETKAPDGYTLDDRVEPLKKLVTMTGVQNPSDDFSGIDKDATKYTSTDKDTSNKVMFVNQKQIFIGGFNGAIDKSVKLTDNNTGYVNVDTSSKSLMYNEVTADYLISGLTDGSNELPAKSFVLTDENLKLQGLTQGSTDKYYDIDAAPLGVLPAYNINSVTLYQSSHMNGGIKDNTSVIWAKLEAKVGPSWQEVKDSGLDHLELIGAGGLKITLPTGTTGIRISYNGIKPHFSAGNVEMNVTFKRRSSNAEIPDIRRIVNTASLTWIDTQLDHQGVATNRTATVMDDASILFPQYDEDVPYLSLKNEIVTGSDQLYYAGGSVQFRSVGKVDLIEGNDAKLEEPVMSITLPPYTTLDVSKYQSIGVGGIRALLKNGTPVMFKLSEPMEIVDAQNRISYKYVLTNITYQDGTPLVMDPGDTIELSYFANIGLKVPDDVITLSATAYFGSARQLPLTKDNPTGTSFKQAGSHTGGMAEDSDINDNIQNGGQDIEGDGLEFLDQPVSIQIAKSDRLQVMKYIGTSASDYCAPGVVPTFNPTDTMYYKLSLVNAGYAVNKARFVDILPFDGDTFEFRDVNSQALDARSSKLPTGEGYEQPTLISVNGNPGGAAADVTVYYYEGQRWDRSTRLTQSADAELPMIWNKQGDVWGGWTTSPSDMSKVTAIGVEVTFPDDAPLEQGDIYDVTLQMRAPGYTAEQMSAYADALMANSCAAAVVRVGDTNMAEQIQPENHVGSNQVMAKLRMTTGSIGDYAFYDDNDNGIQDEGDRPARNVPVSLYMNKKTTSGTDDSVLYKTTVTDNTTGKYLFDELPCNFRTAESYSDPGFASDSENPKYYVGNTYYSYKVVFGSPDGYSPTLQYANGKTDIGYEPLDSNIDAKGETSWISLALTVNADGTLSGENNMTIDAGFVRLVSLGDYVWVDTNRNGIQDDSEMGLDGVKVTLYKLNSAEDTIEGKEPYAQQITTVNSATGIHGYYCFKDLPKGYYVVAFDVTDVKSSGYTAQYSFTMPNAGSAGADSNAKHIIDGNQQYMYTDNIPLFADDMTIDAGVTVYSALGGFVFDDQDYDNTRSLDIPLEGTVVSLYKINEDGSTPDQPIATQTVGADGKYLFDNLEAGRYKVHFDYPENYIGVAPGVGDHLHDSEARYFDDDTLNSGFSDIIELPADTADLTHDAGAYLVSAIGDYVWMDKDKNGLQDDGELPVADVRVKLQGKTASGQWTDLAATRTDADGYYIFQNVKSSDHYDMIYRVVFGFNKSVEITKPYQGGQPEKDSNAIDYVLGQGYVTDSVHPGYGQEDMTIDTGIVEDDELCEIGDYVWYDVNQNGLQDADEEGVEGITVYLQWCESGRVTDASAWTSVATTVTDANGKYIFTGLPAGFYRVGFEIKAPYIITLPSQGSTADAYMYDSDATRKNGSIYYSRSFYMNPGDSDMTWDAGIYLITDKKRPTTTQIIRRTRVVTRSSTRRGSAKTGDSMNIPALVSVTVLAGMLIVLVIWTKYKKRRKNL